MKLLKDDPRVIEMMNNMHQGIAEILVKKSDEELEFEQNNPNLDKYYLFFTADNGNREDCSTYYSDLVIAKNGAEAIDKFLKATPTIDRKYYDDYYTFERMEPII